ncbi:hypothetical protein OPQ81_002242 [Rhizoctonia solani]|nr:hypothetical protein OPQ81_002242 [Rhizoctonia solani]
MTVVAFSDYGKRLISCTNDGLIKIWSVRDDIFRYVLPTKDMDETTLAIYSATRSHIYTGFLSRTRLWDTNAGPLVASIISHTSCLGGSLSLSPDEAAIAVFLDDNSVELVSTKDRSLVAGPFRGHTQPAVSAPFSIDGAYLVTGPLNKSIRVWSIKDGRLAFGPFVGYAGRHRMVSLLSDCSRAISHTEYDGIRGWNLQDGILHADVRVHNS